MYRTTFFSVAFVCEWNLVPYIKGHYSDNRRLETRRLGVRFPIWEEILFSTVPRPVLGPTHCPIPSVPGHFSAGIKLPAREDDYSLPFSAEITNMWRYNFTPLYVIIAGCLVKHRDIYIVMCLSDYRQDSDWWLDLLTTYTLLSRDHTLQITDNDTDTDTDTHAHAHAHAHAHTHTHTH
jgi:hypothetical protein